MKFSNELKVGALVVCTILIAVIFAWTLGIESPFRKTISLYVTYRFAGGIEVGSPVRISGIKVGRVERIEFFVPKTSEDKTNSGVDSETVPLRLRLSVKDEVVKGIRLDSKFFINLAGIIGERYIEITPGSMNLPTVRPNQVLEGIDPPRIDQLFSQSFDLAGKIKEILDENQGDIAKSIELLFKLSANLNKTLEWVEKSKVFKTDLSQLIDNLILITKDMRKVTSRVNTPEGEKTLQLMYQLLWRLEPLNSKEIKTFFQKEGVKVQFF